MNYTYRTLRIIHLWCIIRPYPLLWTKVIVEGIYIYSIRPPLILSMPAKSITKSWMAKFDLWRALIGIPMVSPLAIQLLADNSYLHASIIAFQIHFASILCTNMRLPCNLALHIAHLLRVRVGGYYIAIIQMMYYPPTPLFHLALKWTAHGRIIRRIR